MKQEILERLTEEYKEVIGKINEIDKEQLAIDRSKKENRLGTALLFGVFPTILVTLILARIFAAGIIGLSALTIGSVITTVGLSGGLLAIFEKKWNMKQERKDYNIPTNDYEKLEREVEIQQERQRLESQERAINSYFRKLNDEDYELVNTGNNPEVVETNLKENYDKMINLSNMRFVNDYFEQYRTKNKNVAKSIAAGIILGMLLGSAVTYLPQLMGGVGITGLTTTTFSLITTLLTGAVFGTYSGIKTNNKLKLFNKKNRELGSLELPLGMEPIYIQTRNMLSTAIEEYVETLEQRDTINLPVAIKEEMIEEHIEEQDKTYVKEEVQTLSKKLDA